MSTLSQLRALGLFDARVPRYTSYPTAPQFSDAVGPAETEGWLRAIPDGQEISLYLHIPFCRRLCWFCACRTQGTATLSPVAAYIETLKAEIDLVSERLAPGVRVSHLHWGGGTPTLLSPELIEDLSSHLLGRVPLADGAQFSVEIDPSEVDEARLEALMAAGMNRASIGVQDFDPEIQALIGREQSFEVTSEVTASLRKFGITSVNMDILFGLPGQTRERITSTVQKVMSLSPDRIALYGYAHVPWMARRQSLIPTDNLPTPEERLALFETARKLFLWDGYREIGIDHFARPEDGLVTAADTGRLRRNFQGYTDDPAPVLVGLGASAISRYPQGYAQNDASTSGYQRRVRDGALATTRGHAFAGEDILRARLIEELMCQFRVDLGWLAEETGQDLARLRAIAGPIADAFGKFFSIRNDIAEIAHEGRPLARVIARRFDAYDAAGARHSQAV